MHTQPCPGGNPRHDGDVVRLTGVLRDRRSSGESGGSQLPS
jgi:hypothetical protein